MFAIGMAVCRAAVGASFDPYAKVGAAIDSSGNVWACVIEDSTHIRCAYSNSGGGMSWCTDNWTLPQNYTTAAVSGTPAGIYLVPEFPVGGGYEGVFFMTVKNTSTGYYEIMANGIVDVGSISSCVYPLNHEPAPYMTGNDHPYLTPRMAIARGSGNKVYAIVIVPWDDWYAAGNVVALQVANNGTGAWTWLYPAGDLGLFNGGYTFDPVGYTAGVKSSLTGEPVFVVNDDQAHATSTFGAIYYDGTNWGHIAASQLAGNSAMQGNVAITDVPAQLVNGNRIGDALFTQDASGNLHEVRFKCTNNNGACNGGFALVSLTSHGTGGSAYDKTTDSLTASWYQDGGGDYWTMSYSRVDNSNADSVSSDIINNGGGTSFSALIPGNSGWTTTTDLFKGLSVNNLVNS